MSWVQDAETMARDLHRGQRDRIGEDYFSSHVKPVAMMVKRWGGTEYQVTAAYLHDLVEDTAATPAFLGRTFPEEITTIVEHLTKPEGQPYDVFIRSVVSHPPAVLVKIADITSNMDPARLLYIDPPKRNRLVQKYTDALPVLWSHYQGR